MIENYIPPDRKCPPRFRKNQKRATTDVLRGDVVTPYFTSEATSAQPPVVIRLGAKVIGRVQAEVFHKNIIGSRHLLKAPPAIASDVSALKSAEAAGAQVMEVHDKESGRTYRATIAKIWERGFPVRRGYGDQIGLALKLWAKDNEPVVEQLALFDGGQNG